MDDHSNKTSCSRTTHRHRRSTRPLTTVLAAVAALDALRSTPTASASPLPFPFLDFLYPRFERKSSQRTQLETTQRPETSTTAATRAAEQARAARSISDTQNILSKRAQPPGVRLAVKYEAADSGWVEALSWNLHGRSGGADPNPALDPDSGLDNIQNLDAIGTPITLNDMDPSQLPVGWYRSPRHESYSPVIVTVFAVFLVFSIITTIGLCRWRKAKLRKLRDVERLERKQKGLESSSDDEDSGGEPQIKEKSGNKKESLRKRYKAFGKSTAIRRVNDRFVARLRRKHHRSQPAENTSDPITDSPQTPLAVPSVRTADLSSPSRVSLDHGPRPATPHVENNPHSPSTQPEEEELPALQETRAPNNTADESNNQPPAYPSSTRPITVRQREKAPIRGREGDYDERDLTGYVNSFDAVTLAMPAQAPETSTSQEAAPSFEASIVGSTHVAAGGIRQAHVATDDKVALERLRTMADAPVSSSSTLNRPTVPAWREMDEWHAEQQLESLPPTELAPPPPTSSQSSSSPSSQLPLPPPPSTIVVPSIGYNIGHYWSYMGSDNTSSSRAGPSAPPPPTDLDEPSVPHLMPSAPPILAEEEEGDRGAEASAPVWDDSVQEVDIMSREAGHDRSTCPGREGSSSSSSVSASSPSPSSPSPSSSASSGDRSRSPGQSLPRYEP